MPESVIAAEVFRTNRHSLFDGQEAPDEQGGRRRLLASLMANIHSLVEEAAAIQQRPFVPRLERDGSIAYDCSAWAQRYFSRFPMLIQIIRSLSPKFSYGEPVELFRAACAELELDRLDNFPELSWRPETPFRCGTMTNADSFNALHAIIRRDWASQGYRAKYQRRRRDTEKRLEKYRKYAIACLGIPPRRSMVLRLDLYYRPEHQSKVTIEDLRDDLDHLYGNFRCNAIFKGKVGYIEKIEYGIDKGLHVHVIFIYDGRDKNPLRHVYHAERIGEYWANVITKGRGAYWNCNAAAAKYEALGIRGVGPIEPKDWRTRENFLNRVVAYLCKEEQFLRPAGLNGVRLMRCGQPPKIAAKEEACQARDLKDDSWKIADAADLQTSEVSYGEIDDPSVTQPDVALSGAADPRQQHPSEAPTGPGELLWQNSPSAEAPNQPHCSWSPPGANG